MTRTTRMVAITNPTTLTGKLTATAITMTIERRYRRDAVCSSSRSAWL